MESYDLERGADKLQRLQSLWQRFGDCYRVSAASRAADTWVVTQPDWVRRILVTNHRNYTKGVGIERVRLLLGNGLMASEGELWRRQRRLLQAAFHKPRVETLFPLYHRQAHALAQRWLAAARAGQSVDVSAALGATTLEAVLEAVLSEDLHRFDDAAGRSPFHLVCEERQRDLAFAVRFRALSEPIRAVIDDRRRAQRFPPDLLSHCLLARASDGAPMSDKQLVDELLTLIVAGHETTAAALSWTWYLLATHPDSFRQLQAEVQGLDPARVPDWRTLERLPFVTQVIREALRLYPPGWLYTRRALAADRLGDYQVPAGTDLFICSWLLHRHPAYWEQPEAFRPQRFAPDGEAQRGHGIYLPFSAGPRHCIGESFALAEMVIHLAVLARYVQPQAPDGPRLEAEADVNLRPRTPLSLTFSAADAARG